MLINISKIRKFLKCPFGQLELRVRRLPDPHDDVNWGKGRITRIVREHQKDPKNRQTLRQCITDGKSREVMINGEQWRIHNGLP